MGSVRTGSAGLFLLLAALTVIGCGDSGRQATTAAGRPRSVNISDYLFAPATLTVPTGTKVTFHNEDATAHTATSKQPGAFDTDSIDPGKSATVTFSQPGTFAYYCVFHPFMKGTVEVE
jgi:plastocyanin